MPAFCIRCRTQTVDANPTQASASNGRQMVKSTCGVCGTKKNQFVSGVGRANSALKVKVKKVKKTLLF